MRETTYRVEYLKDGVWEIWSCYGYLGTARNRAADLIHPTRITEITRKVLP